MAAEQPDFAMLIRPWAKRWGLPGIESGIRVRYSGRLHRSLGRSWPTRGEIVLHPGLQQAKREELAMVLCHEAAHIAAYQLYGRAASPHGPEWAALVRSAGYAPVTSTPAVGASASSSSPRAITRSIRRLVLHRCPVCQTERIARRVVSGWRCAECVAAGLEGRLETTVRTVSA